MIYECYLLLGVSGSVVWGCGIHRLHLSNECPGYETKQADGEVRVMLEVSGIQSTPSLPSLPCPL